MSKKVLITGAAGFIGSNVVSGFSSKGYKLIGIDNLSRKGTEKNLSWLKANFSNFKFYEDDVRDAKRINRIFQIEKPDIVIHLAAQVAVTTSVEAPIEDKEINIDGTLNVLEAARKLTKKVPFLFSSTNKVYGELEEFSVKELKSRYVFRNREIGKYGISEKVNLDFHSPYGCSKGAADQYVHDYFRIYEIPTVVFRQSCIYGPRQFGNEDQGWVMHFVKMALEAKEINIFGDGKQVRDILHVADLVDLYDLAINKISQTKGHVYNVGGGTHLTVSLLELLSRLEKLLGKEIQTKFWPWRPGDQKIFFADIRNLKKIGWSPKIGLDKGLKDLVDWGKQIT